MCLLSTYLYEKHGVGFCCTNGKLMGFCWYETHAPEFAAAVYFGWKSYTS